jgi:hypothetical protein
MEMPGVLRKYFRIGDGRATYTTRMPAARCFGVVLVLGLAACASGGLESEVHVVAPGNFRAGSGVIQSVAVLPNKNPKPAPAAGGAAPDRNLYRLFIQMDVGGFQSVDVDTAGFMAGQAVDLTNDGRVVRVSGTALMKNRDAER